MPATVYFTSDAHLGHRRITEFSPARGVSASDHDQWFCDHWTDIVRRRADVVWCLGDMAFTAAALDRVRGLGGRKRLIAGNHDWGNPVDLASAYDGVFGLVKKYGFWMSHAPVHPAELRGRPNVHGHVHSDTVPDARYLNLCVENLVVATGRPIVPLDWVRAQLFTGGG